MLESVRLIRQASASFDAVEPTATTGKPNTHHFNRQRNAPPSSGRAPMSSASGATSPSSLGVYVHFPWCLSKCPYCDFVVHAAPRASIDHAGYANAVLAELG